MSQNEFKKAKDHLHRAIKSVERLLESSPLEESGHLTNALNNLNVYLEALQDKGTKLGYS